MSIFPTPGHERAHRLLALRADLVLQGAGGRGERDGEADVRSVDLDVADEVQRDQVPVELRLLDRSKRVAHLLRCDMCL